MDAACIEDAELSLQTIGDLLADMSSFRERVGPPTRIADLAYARGDAELEAALQRLKQKPACKDTP